MKTNMKKKGFTLVELLVVIAIIAILAVVSVVGYTTFINKANMSADQQAVDQMNTMLEALDVTNEPQDIVALWAYLNETGLTAEDYRPLSKGHIFVWDKDLNRILLVDENEKVVYPEDYTNVVKSNNWYNLATTSVITGEAPEVDANGAVAIGSASDLVTSIMNVNENPGTIKTMNVAGDINLLGSSAFIPDIQAKSTLTIEGAENATITNLVSTEYATVGKANEKDPSTENQQYAAGFIGKLESGEKLVIKNITIDGAILGDYETGCTGIIVGNLTGGELVLENVTIKNCTVYGQNKVGIIAGHVSGGSKVTMTNVKIENCTVKSSEGEAGQMFGVIANTATFDINDQCSVTNTKVSIDAYGNHQTVTINGVQYVTKVDGNGNTDKKTIDGVEYIRVCKCSTENTLAWDGTDTAAYGTDAVVNETYCGRTAVELTSIDAINALNK